MAMMDMNLEGKTALITASVTGIGLATAQQLCSRGVKVWINGRKPERIEAGMVTPGVIVDYGVCKAAVIRLSRSVAEIFQRSKGVTVNCVSPGGTIADWVYREQKKSGKTFEQFERDHFDQSEATSLLGRFAEADEVANMITYLCTPASNATRGAVLRVDGGPVRTD